MTSYDPEKYWDRVAQAISKRKDLSLIAGDDEPYYEYKRKLFLRILKTIDFTNKKVLEIGSGPGGNLHFISSKNPEKIVGVDVSSQMIKLSSLLLKGKNVELYKIDGQHLPFENNSFDIVFTSTVLQHNTNEEQLQFLIREISRVSSKQVVLFERIESRIKGHETNTGRPVGYYEQLFNAHGFYLKQKKFLRIQCSYLVCGVVRKLFNSNKRREGEPLSKLSIYLEKIVLPFSSAIDKLIPGNRDLCCMRFEKE